MSTKSNADGPEPSANDSESNTGGAKQSASGDGTPTSAHSTTEIAVDPVGPTGPQHPQDASLQAQDNIRQRKKADSSTADVVRLVSAGIGVVVGYALIIVPVACSIIGFSDFLWVLSISDWLSGGRLIGQIGWIMAAKALIVGTSVGSGLAVISFAGKLMRPLWMDDLAHSSGEPALRQAITDLSQLPVGMLEKILEKITEIVKAARK